MSSKSLKYSALLAACLGVAALAGCGSSNKSGSTHLAKVGDTACVQCHSAVTEALTGQSIIAQYENSSPHNTEALGCESCHGAGSLHNGVGPIPYPQPDANRCATCHDGVTARATNANTAFETSNHATGTPSHTSGVCVRCHTHEGAVLSNISGYTGDATVIGSSSAPTPYGPPAYTGAYSGIKCESCHEHGGGLRSIIAKNTAGVDVAWNPSGTNGAKNNQFNLCTSCHTMYNYNGTKLLADGVSTVNGVVTGQVGYHSTSWYRIIATTHYDDPTTTNVIEGYNIRKNGDNPCFDCHGHEAKTETRYAGTDPTQATIQTDWAQSAHAGGLLANKYASNGGSPTVASVLAAGATSATGDGWVHYNWDDNASRGSCQRCHTATGAANFMSNPSGYDATQNTFSHLSNWTAAGGSPQQEVLYCWGCHTNAGTGELRNPGAITETYSPGTAGDPATTIAYPDIAGSNVCMTCHLGRETGEVIKNDQDADGIRSFINSHYLSAGGQLFGTTGYEYDGVSYANPSYFAHDKIGSTAAPGTGSNGPCAGCHMTTPNSHSFNNVAKDNAGVITALTSTACVTCHDGTHGTALTAGSAAAATFLETEKEHYHAALNALDAALQAKGIYFFNAHPYFYQAANGAGGAYTNWAGPYGFANWKNVMGAAFNFNLLEHDPGGYAHNRIYSKRLIFDAIDFIDNGVLDGVITVTGDAATYLDGNAATAGVQRP